MPSYNYKEIALQTKSPLPSIMNYYQSRVKVNSLPILPYVGSSQQEGLAYKCFLWDLYTSSSIFKSLIKNINDWAFGGGIVDSSFISNFNIINLDITSLLCKREINKRVYGFSATMVIKTVVNNETVYTIKTIDPRAVDLCVDDMEGFVIYNPFFMDKKSNNGYYLYSTERFYREITSVEFEAFKNKGKDGVSNEDLSTDNYNEYLIVIDTDNDSVNEIYGDSYIDVPYAFVDAQRAGMLVKKTSRELVARYLLFLEQPNLLGQVGDTNTELSTEDMLEGLQHKITSKLTNASNNPNSIGFFQYPNGSKEPTLHELKVNQDTDYNKYLDSLLVKKMYGRNGVDPILSGLIETQTGLSSGISLRLGALYSLEALTLPPVRNSAISFVNKILNSINESDGLDQVRYDIEFYSPISTLIEKLSGTGLDAPKS